MTIQPINVIQPFGKPVNPILPVNTLDTYTAAIRAKHGPFTWAKLATLENRAMQASLKTTPGAQAFQRKNLGLPRLDPAYSCHDAPISAILAKGPATARDIADALGLHPDTARDHLRRLTQAQRIACDTSGKSHVYTLPGSAK